MTGGTGTDTDAWWSVGDRAEPADDSAATQPIALPHLPLTRSGRPARAVRPAALPPARAFAGAAVAVAGVALGIGTLLWATEPPAGDPTVRPATAAADAFDEPAVPEPDAVVEAPAPPAAAPVPPPAPAPPAPAPPAPAVAAPDPLVVPVLVLNNSRIEGLAERAARSFEAAGWPVRDTGGLRGRIRASTVYYEPGQQASARALADRVGIPRVLPRLDGLPGSGLTVVVTRDFVGQ